MKKIALFLLLILFALSACGGAASFEERYDSADGGAAPAAEPEFAPESPAEGESAGGEAFDRDASVPPPVQGAQLDRKIVYTASIRLRVDEPMETAQGLQALARQFGGYVSSANVYEVRDEVYQATVQLRVDATQFDAALAALRGLGTEVLNEQLDSQDVTDRFVDLSARIENLERTEEELQLLLSEARERGGKTEDILQIYRELTSVREQIELYQGQLNVLSDQVSLATINVELYPPEVQVELLDEGWSPMRTIRQALRNLTEGMQGLADLAIFFTLNMLPFLLLLGFLFFVAVRLLVWLWRRRPDALRPRPTPPTPAAPPAAPPTTPAE